MSRVTNIMLSLDICEDEKVIAGIKDFPHFHRGTCPAPVQVSSMHIGGDKCLEMNLFIGAYNHFPLDDFCEFLRTMPCYYPENVRLLVAEEEDNYFHMEFPRPRSRRRATDEEIHLLDDLHELQPHIKLLEHDAVTLEPILARVGYSLPFAQAKKLFTRLKEHAR